MTEYWRKRRSKIWHAFKRTVDTTPCILGEDGPIYGRISMCERHEFELDSRQTDGWIPWPDRGRPKIICGRCLHREKEQAR